VRRFHHRYVKLHDVEVRALTEMENPEPAKVFEDRLTPGDWRVEWEDEDGGVEVTIFSGPDARERAIQYADWQYRQFVELPQRSG
jgi:hypothetical protein